jgi:translin
MERLEAIASEIESELDEKDAVREVALKASRGITRLCGSAVRSMHKGKDVGDMLGEATDELQKLVSITRDFPDIKHAGFVETAMQEYTEARMFNAFLSEQPIPSPKDLNVTPEAYILGIGDLIGELRRQALDNIRKGEVDAASARLETMELLYEFLMRFHYPNSLVAIKRKQDVARGVLEKTRGEVAVAIRTHSLERKLRKE